MAVPRIKRRPAVIATALVGAPALLALAAAPALAATPTPSATTPVQLVRASYANPAVIGTVPSYVAGSNPAQYTTYSMKLGGFSALAPYTDPSTHAVSSTDFWTLTDRGANGTGPSPASGQSATQGFVVPTRPARTPATAATPGPAAPPRPARTSGRTPTTATPATRSPGSA